MNSCVIEANSPLNTDWSIERACMRREGGVFCHAMTHAIPPVLISCPGVTITLLRKFSAVCEIQIPLEKIQKSLIKRF